MTVRTTTRTRTNMASRTPASRVAVFPYGPSDSLNDFMPLFRGALEMPAGRTPRIRREGSAFRGRTGDVIVNWGSSAIPAPVIGNARVLNHPTAVALASNKRQSFDAFRANDVQTVEHTTDRSEAQRWLADGGIVYARTRLSGHSGEGIVVCKAPGTALPDLGDVEVSETLVTAQLYTKGETRQRREFRVHVAGGVISHVQQKKRSEGWRENANYSNVVRNYHTGWIYALADVRVNDAGRANAIAAVAALGLDFGAVDIITRGEEAWVLEVNTAPGLSGTNMEHYVRNLTALSQGQPVVPNQPTVVREDTSEGTDAAPVAAEPEGELEVILAHQARNQTRAAHTWDPNVAQAVPVAFAAPVAPPAPPAPRQTVREATAAARATANYVNGAFYRAVLRGVTVVVQFNSQAGGFYACGWEVVLRAGNGEGEIVVGARLEV